MDPEDSLHHFANTPDSVAWIGLPLEDAGYVKFKVSPGSITHLREGDFLHDRQVVALNLLSHLG